MVKSDTEARDLFYHFDTVGRFHASQTPNADADPCDYISFAALGKAILHAKPPSYASQTLRVGVRGGASRRGYPQGGADRRD